MLEKRAILEQLFVGTSNRHQESPGTASSGSRDDDDNDGGQASSARRSKDPRYFFALAPDEDEESTCSSSIYDSIHNRETGKKITDGDPPTIKSPLSPKRSRSLSLLPLISFPLKFHQLSIHGFVIKVETGWAEGGSWIETLLVAIIRCVTL